MLSLSASRDIRRMSPYHSKLLEDVAHYCLIMSSPPSGPPRPPETLSARAPGEVLVCVSLPCQNRPQDTGRKSWIGEWARGPVHCLPLLASGAVSGRHQCLFSRWCPLAGAPGRWVRTGRRNDQERKGEGETSLGLGSAVGPARYRASSSRLPLTPPTQLQGSEPGIVPLDPYSLCS